MKTIPNISKINIKLTLILSVLVMLLSIENSNAKSKSRVIIDSLKSLEGKITIIKDVNITNTRFKNTKFEVIDETKFSFDEGIEIFDSKFDFYYTKDIKLFSGYLILFNEIDQGQGYLYYRKSVKEMIFEFEKLHLKGKVGVLDNLVPIKWM